MVSETLPEFIKLRDRYVQTRLKGVGEHALLVAATRDVDAGVFDEIMTTANLSAWFGLARDRESRDDRPLLLRLYQPAVDRLLEAIGYHRLYEAWVIAHQAQRLLGEPRSDADWQLRIEAWSLLLNALLQQRDVLAWGEEVLAVCERAAETCDAADDQETALAFRSIRMLLLFRKGQFDEAQAIAERLVPRSDSHPRIDIRGRCRLMLADCLVLRGKLHEALSHFDAALAHLAGTHPMHHAQAQVHRARCLIQLGRFAEAEADLDTGLPRLRGHSLNAYAVGLSSLAQLHFYRGQPDLALEQMREAQRTFARIGDRLNAWRAGVDSVGVLASLNQADTGLHAIELLLSSIPQGGHGDAYVKALLYKGVCFYLLGREPEALTTLREARTLARDQELAGEYALALMYIAVCLYSQAAMYDEAIALLEEALPIFASVAAPAYPLCLLNHAICLHRADDYDGALAQFSLAIEHLGVSGNPNLRAYALVALANCLDDAEKHDEAASCAEDALAITADLGDRARETSWRAHYALAFIAAIHRDDLASAREHLDRALAVVESLGVQPSRFADRISLRATYADVYRLAPLLKTESLEASFAAVQLAKARTLNEFLPHRAVPPSARRETDGPLRRASRTAGALVKHGTARLLGRRAQGNADIPATTLTPQMLLGTLRAFLRDDEVVLDCHNTIDGSLLLFLVGKQGIIGGHHVSAPTFRSLVSAYDNARDTMLARIGPGIPPDPTELWLALTRLRAALLAPLEANAEQGDLLAGRRTIFVSPSGASHRLPWAAIWLAQGDGPRLPAEAPPPGAGVCIIPALATLGQLRQRPSLPAGTAPDFLGIAPFAASPPSDATAQPWRPTVGLALKGSRIEVADAAALVARRAPAARRDVLLDERASRQRFLDYAPHATLILAATHGTELRAGDSVLDFGLQFAPDAASAAPGDPPATLRMWDLIAGASKLRPGSHALLTACHLGDALARGDEAIGFGHAFLLAGAQACLAPLWPVDDAATRVLSLAYLDALLDGVAPSIALSRAMHTIRGKHRWRHPYYWAGFVLVGDGAHSSFPALLA